MSSSAFHRLSNELLALIWYNTANDRALDKAFRLVHPKFASLEPLLARLFMRIHISVNEAVIDGLENGSLENIAPFVRRLVLKPPKSPWMLEKSCGNQIKGRRIGADDKRSEKDHKNGDAAAGAAVDHSDWQRERTRNVLGNALERAHKLQYVAVKDWNELVFSDLDAITYHGKPTGVIFSVYNGPNTEDRKVPEYRLAATHGYTIFNLAIEFLQTLQWSATSLTLRGERAVIGLGKILDPSTSNPPASSETAHLQLAEGELLSDEFLKENEDDRTGAKCDHVLRACANSLEHLELTNKEHISWPTPYTPAMPNLKHLLQDRDGSLEDLATLLPKCTRMNHLHFVGNNHGYAWKEILTAIRDHNNRMLVRFDQLPANSATEMGFEHHTSKLMTYVDKADPDPEDWYDACLAYMTGTCEWDGNRALAYHLGK